MWGIKRAVPAKKVECTAEYIHGHWIVLIRNAGHTDWVPVQDHTRLITDYDVFGDTIRVRAAIMTFETKNEADEYIKNSIPDSADSKNVRDPSRDSVRFSAGAEAAIESFAPLKAV